MESTAERKGPEVRASLAATFLQRVEQRKRDAKHRLRQQVDLIVDDFFGQLVLEISTLLQQQLDHHQVITADDQSVLKRRQSLVESIVCEPSLVDMSCLLFGGGGGQSILSTLQGEPRQTSTVNRTIDGDYDLDLSTSTEKDCQLQSNLESLTSNFCNSSCTDSDQSDDGELMDHEDHENLYLHAQKQLTSTNGHHASPHDQSPPIATDQNQPIDLVSSRRSSKAFHSNDHDQWICPHCEKRMKNERTLYMHKWRYHKPGHFPCAEPDCTYAASYRIQLRTHHIRCHDLGKYCCPFPGCGRAFNRRNSLKRHERIHLRLKPYRCKWGEGCEYASELRSSMIDHVRVTHFRLPRSRKEQAEMHIGDDRDPADYFEVISEGLDLLEPVLEHVSSVLEQVAHQQQQPVLPTFQSTSAGRS